MPGLLQTADYARSIMTVGGVPQDEIDMRVAVRLGRRDAITRKQAAQLRAFIGESVLHQLIGGEAVMADQLRALLECSEMPNVELRIIPMRCDWHPGLEGPFSLDEFEGRTPVVQLENRVSALFLHESDEVAAYLHAVDRIADVAMSQLDSIELISDAIGRTERAK